MLINCPRCGFQQPQDKYCAQCGVDMETFKPRTQSALKRLFANPLFQLSLLLVISGGVGFLIFEQGQRKVASQVNPPPKVLQINSQTSSALNAEPAAKPEEAVTDASSTLAPIEANTLDTPPELVPDEGSLSENAKTPPSANSASTKATNSKLVIYYAEVFRSSLQRLFDDSQATGQFMSFGDYSAGILPGLKRRLSPSNAGIKVLHREEKIIDGKTPLRWFYGRGDTGLGNMIEPLDVEKDSFRGNFEVRRVWVEMTPNQSLETTSKSFPATIEITPGTGFFMSGTLPRRTPLDRDPGFTSIDIYKILRSPAFQTGDSEFVIFIEFEKND